MRLKREINQMTIVFLLNLLLWIGGAPGALGAAPKKVLILHSYHQGLSWTDNVMRGMLAVLNQADIDLEIHAEYMDTKRHRPQDAYPYLEELFRQKYAQTRFDVILLSDNNALNFLLARRDPLFGAAPVVFCGVNNFSPDMLEGQTGITGVTEEIDIKGTLKLASQIMPTIQRFVVINDQTVTGRANRKKFEHAIAGSSTPKFSYLIWDDMSAAMLAKRLEGLPNDAAVLVFTFHRDKDGKWFSIPEYLRLIRTSCNAPIFSLWDNYLDQGVMGGVMVYGEAQGEGCSQYALRILRGDSADALPIVTHSPNVPVLDYRLLRKWGVSRSNIPQDVRILFQPESLFLKYRALIILSAVSFLALIVLVITLCINNLKRRKIEHFLKRKDERLKEFRCLYHLSQLIETPNLSIESLLPKSVHLFATGWQYPEITCARIQYEGRVYTTPNFKKTDWRMTRDLVVDQRAVGTLEIGYLEKRPAADQGPFLKEESQLITALAERLQRMIQRKRIQQKLERQNRLLDAAQRLVQMGGWDYDIATRTMQWTDQVFRIHDLDPTETKTTDFNYIEFSLECFAPMDRPKIKAAFQKCIDQGEPYDLECGFITPTGKYKQIRTAAQARRRGGQVVRLVGHIMDITEQHQIKTQYRSLFRQMLDGFALHEIICDAQGAPVDYRFLAVNPAFERLTGLKEEKIINRTVREVLPQTEQTWIDAYGRVALTGEPNTFENYSRALDKHFEVSAYRPAPNQFACIFVDVTDRQKMQKRLQQAQKMEAVGALASGVAHDFNNILFPIMGFAEMLREDLPSENPLHKYVDEIYHAALRARDLVKQILTFSRQANQEIMPIQLQPIVKEALKLLRSTIPTTIEIRQTIDSTCGVVLADPTQFHQIVMNLATNAFHAMENSGGVLSVTLKQIRLEADEGGFQNLAEGNYALFIVNDTGKGIEKDVLDKIFDPYFTTKKEGKGTGLGLSVVMGIVKSCNGDIRVYSEPGRGTEFHVYLPIMRRMPPEKRLDESQPVKGGHERILLVDDEEAIIHMEHQMLERLGYRVTSRMESLEALEVFKADPHQFDLVITDFTMPNITGSQLAREIKKIRPDIPVILCTGFSHQIDEETCQQMGIQGYVMKPVLKKKIAEVIRRVLDGVDRVLDGVDKD